MVQRRPRLKLTELRRIGWSMWDPIGLGGLGGDCENEYDGYLIRVAADLIDGRSQKHCVAFLIDSEANRMGLGLSDKDRSRRRAEATVTAIKAHIEERQHADD